MYPLIILIFHLNTILCFKIHTYVKLNYHIYINLDNKVNQPLVYDNLREPMLSHYFI